MNVKIFINGSDYLGPFNNFSESFLKIINENSRRRKFQRIFRTKTDEIENLIEICQKDELVFCIDNHLTLNADFASKLQRFDIVYCDCLLPKTETGKIIKELMVDNYQLVLSERRWLKTDFLSLNFELTNGEETYDYLADINRGTVKY